MSKDFESIQQDGNVQLNAVITKLPSFGTIVESIFSDADCARRLGRFAGDQGGQDAKTFHAPELNAVFAFWDGSGDN